MATTKLEIDNVIEKIREASGNLTTAARLLGISRQTLYNYLRTRPSVQAAIEESRESMIDNVESSLYKAALAGEGWAVCFFLKTQAKRRGYVERQEITGADGGAVQIVVDWDTVAE